MAKNAKLSRRSFLLNVSGGIVSVGAMASMTGQAEALQQYTGETDSDGGSNADRAGYGRC